MKIIMISGKSGSGKDQLSEYVRQLLEQQERRVLTIHFGDPVKFFLTKYYNWDGQKDEHGRTMLQKLGTDVMRNKFPTYWAESIAKFIAATQEDWDYVLIPDWRFINEMTTVKHYNNNVVTVRINRLNENGSFVTNPAFTQEQLNHISECELDDFYCDWLVDNSGNLSDLAARAIELVKEISE